MTLTSILQPNCVKVPLEGKDKKSVITELVDLLAASKLITNRDEALDAVLAREKMRSTGIGSGIAIPHGKCKTAVKELVMAIGIAKKPVEFESIDKKPATIIILLVSPQNQTGPHIQALAKISRLLSDKQFKEKLENADSAEEVYRLVSDKEIE